MNFQPRTLLAACCAAAMSVCCSGGGDDSGTPAGGGTISVAGAGSSGLPGTGAGGSSGVPNPGGDGRPDPASCSLEDETGCVGETFEGENVPLDIYILFDQSGSMLNDVGGSTRLEAVRAATEQFLRDPASAGIRVGIGYFGFQTIGEASCEPAVYASPDVAIVADHEAVIRSLAGREPTGETPTGSAIRGACEYTSGYKLANPARSLVQLLVTDGKPEAPMTCSTKGTCCPTLSDAADAAQECLAGPGAIKTYVLGVGPFLESLTEIARAGGTEQAYLVDDQDVTRDVLAALNAIRANASIPCAIAIPEPADGQVLDYARVNVAYAGAECRAAEFFPYVESPAACDGAGGGWYYDDPAAPGFVELCPSTCARVSEPGGHLLVALGCSTKIPIE